VSGGQPGPMSTLGSVVSDSVGRLVLAGFGCVAEVDLASGVNRVPSRVPEVF
jgi:hypothetical protein